MRMLATGQNSLPSQGIGAVADQLAAALPAGSIRTGWCYVTLYHNDNDDDNHNFGVTAMNGAHASQG